MSEGTQLGQESGVPPAAVKGLGGAGGRLVGPKRDASRPQLGSQAGKGQDPRR